MSNGLPRRRLRKGTIILSWPDEGDCVNEARAWLRKQGYTTEDVRLYRQGGQILGKLLRDV